MKKVLMPIPTYGFDPTEVAIPWKLLTESGHQVSFITPNGSIGATDEIMLTGKGLGILKKLLMARQDAVDAYKEMIETDSFNNPLKYDAVLEKDFDGIILPGGHDKSVKEYLESTVLQNLVVDFFRALKPVGAICHGVVVAARSIDPKTEKSVLHNYKTTALLKRQELAGYNLTKLWLKDYYLTYPGLTVEDEIKSNLVKKENFIEGPMPMFRDSREKLSIGFTVRFRNYLSARWPGDVYNFSLEFINMIES